MRNFQLVFAALGMGQKISFEVSLTIMWEEKGEESICRMVELVSGGVRELLGRGSVGWWFGLSRVEGGWR